LPPERAIEGSVWSSAAVHTGTPSTVHSAEPAAVTRRA
jgi:hypothetical protein